ncbi:DNA-3-methyladenine glycosylase I [Lacticaseibacillus pabuli]|uniref:DNA-3-methyladenine glycosylase I n=1 Tax=Lacticaseibacillus pabuli TaxID=3025672 RepID=A0ABY7WVU5_9LACO|nr:DNA-3-methyladenine glycosylase I [Lacticaseibacillus sp. KACC 23028]WDF83121.1 DNA-3-methyladenine glycosylase I [Lacticaseibacillus sp. KACC 23028]
MELLPNTDAKFWANRNALLQDYYLHDWGMPKHDNRDLLGLLVMEIMSAGLNWEMILKRRDALTEAFAGWDAGTIAAWGEADFDRLMTDPSVIHNRMKIEAAFAAARATVALTGEYRDLDDYVWSFTAGEQIQNHPTAADQVPNHSKLSKWMATDMKGRGFKFVGPVIVYNYLEAAGVIDDHIESALQ